MPSAPSPRVMHFSIYHLTIYHRAKARQRVALKARRANPGVGARPAGGEIGRHLVDRCPCPRVPASGRAATSHCADVPSGRLGYDLLGFRRSACSRGARRRASGAPRTAAAPARRTASPSWRSAARRKDSMAAVRSPAMRCISPSRMPAAMPSRFFAVWTRKPAFDVSAAFFDAARGRAGRSRRVPA